MKPVTWTGSASSSPPSTSSASGVSCTVSSASAMSRPLLACEQVAYAIDERRAIHDRRAGGGAGRPPEPPPPDAARAGLRERRLGVRRQRRLPRRTARLLAGRV